MPAPKHVPLPEITPKFITAVRDIVTAAEDSIAKRFMEMLYAQGDKSVTSFFTRLQNALNRDIPMDRMLNGMEKRCLSKACGDFAQSEEDRLVKKQESGSLNMEEDLTLHLLERRLEPPLDYEKRYTRRGMLGCCIQLGAIALTPFIMQGQWHLDEQQRAKETKKWGRDRSAVYNFYCKAKAEGKGLLQGAVLFLMGDVVKVHDIAPSTVWRAKGDELMKGLNQLLVSHQMMQESEKEQGR